MIYWCGILVARVHSLFHVPNAVLTIESNSPMDSMDDLFQKRAVYLAKISYQSENKAYLRHNISVMFIDVSLQIRELEEHCSMSAHV